MAPSANSVSLFDEPLPMGNMRCTGNCEIALKSAAIDGTIEGLLFSSTIRQEHRNETGNALEIIYAIPVAWDTTLLGMRATLGDMTLAASVVKKEEAEEKYEEAVDMRDAAIMLRESSPGIYTANLGNIKPGEIVSIEIDCAKLLTFDQGQIRLAIPAVIGKRYSDPHCIGGVAAHESDVVDPDARYPFRLSLTLLGAVAEALVACPTHNAKIRKNKNRTVVQLDSGAWLDRDFVLLIKATGAESRALAAPDGDNWMVSASFCPAMENVATGALALKILVDCSSSMSGACMEQAKKGLLKIISLLSPDDRVSFSCFGNNVRHAENTMLECTPETMEILARQIEGTEANMGGTEMEKAILSTIDSISADSETPPVMLLITDGDIWDAKRLISQAANSGHRIFVLGVGASPAESVLMRLAHITGGICEFVTPNENMAGAVVRMFHRMRGKITSAIEASWGANPVWQSRAPRSIYDGETVHMFALLHEKPELGPFLSWKADGREFETRIGRIAFSDSQILVRLARKRQLGETIKKADKLRIALDYQLVSDFTSLVLVHEGTAGDKTISLAKTQQAQQMPASGNGCSGAVVPSAVPDLLRRASFRHVGPSFCAPFHPRNSPRRIRQSAGLERNFESVEKVVALWRNNLFKLNTLADFINLASSRPSLKPITDLINNNAGDLMLPEEQAWAVFIDWALHMAGKAMEHQARRLLKNWLDDETETDQLREEFDRWLNTGEII